MVSGIPIGASSGHRACNNYASTCFVTPRSAPPACTAGGGPAAPSDAPGAAAAAAARLLPARSIAPSASSHAGR